MGVYLKLLSSVLLLSLLDLALPTVLKTVQKCITINLKFILQKHLPNSANSSVVASV